MLMFHWLSFYNCRPVSHSSYFPIGHPRLYPGTETMDLWLCCALELHSVALQVPYGAVASELLYKAAQLEAESDEERHTS